MASEAVSTRKRARRKPNFSHSAFFERREKGKTSKRHPQFHRDKEPARLLLALSRGCTRADKAPDCPHVKEEGLGDSVQLKFTKSNLKRMTELGNILPLLALFAMPWVGLSTAGVLQMELMESQRRCMANRPTLAEAQHHKSEIKAQLHSSELFIGRKDPRWLLLKVQWFRPLPHT